MTQKELYEYIKNRKYRCCFCQHLQREVNKHGVQAIKDYKGMVCGSVEDMKIRFFETTDNKKINAD